MAQTHVSDIDVHPYLGAHDQDSAGWIGEVLPVPSACAIGAEHQGGPKSSLKPPARADPERVGLARVTDVTLQVARREARVGSGADR